jgi:hypothetical protein
MKRRTALALAVFGLAGSGCVVCRTWWKPSIPALGGRNLQIRLPERCGTFLQNDARWKNEPLGTTHVTLGSHGCTVCSVAMACTNLGVPVSPAGLNERLRAREGYLSRGWLVWSALPRATDGHLTAEYHAKPAHEHLDAALESGAFPIIQYPLPNGALHWVLVVGKEGQDYLVRDPLHDSPSPLRLSTLTQRIRAVRVVKRFGVPTHMRQMSSSRS